MSSIPIIFRCPICRGPLAGHGGALVCADDGMRCEAVDGVYDFMTAAEREEHARFLDEYRAIRRAEGRGSDDAEYYLALPEVGPEDPRHAEWMQRSESMRWLEARLARSYAGAPLSILDAGAGNCWLSRRLAEAGHDVVAADVNDDPYDGLLAGRVYLEHLPVAFDRVRADFASLPFADAQFDVVVFNGSFHYAHDMRAVLAEARRVTRAGGEIIITDSPIYSDFTSGVRMVEERRVKGRAGFLTFAGLRLMAQAVGLRLGIEVPPVALIERLKRKVTEFRLGREIATMGKVVFGIAGTRVSPKMQAATPQEVGDDR